ncbi:Mu transposase C-terminal domain-containing protein [Rhodococcus sp. M8-35]|uniref:Mu transposase C-terminal domain-containing protein n=1 Tax=Rhodococcus sp. M8-35 TaxID=3058401 RepID=UPI0040547098
MDRLAVLDQAGDLTSEHVRLIAQALGVTERTVWRWVRARRTPPPPPKKRGRFRIDADLRVRLAYWRGNASALHRELLEQEKQGGAPTPSLATLHRAIRQDVSPGDRAGLREGERARRRFDVFLQRPPSHRNVAWEADHVEAPVQVEADGRLVKPWVTWFVDAAHDVILGVAVTPRTPNRESVLAALRAAVMRREPYGPAGGLPAVVRIDRGKDFLSRTVADALGALAVRVDDLPAYGAHLKGTVETINGAAERMLFAGLPRYTHRQTRVSGGPVDPDQPPLSFEAFTAEVLSWVRWWNTEHILTDLGDRSPMQSWSDDPTPIHDADETRLWMFTLDDDRRHRTITTKGVAFGRGRHYIADWMVGLVGTQVRIRYMPHHTGEIEVFDAGTGVHLGTAVLADAAPPQTRARVQQARARKARALRADLAAAERERRVRYAASTVPEPAQRLDAMTAAEAAAVLAAERDADMARWARPDLIPFGPPPASWRLPVDPNGHAHRNRNEDRR